MQVNRLTVILAIHSGWIVANPGNNPRLAVLELLPYRRSTTHDRFLAAILGLSPRAPSDRWKGSGNDEDTNGIEGSICHNHESFKRIFPCINSPNGLTQEKTRQLQDRQDVAVA